MDLLSVIGFLFGLAAILVGQALEGGHVSSLANVPAVLIVFGGTVGAVMLQSPIAVFLHALRMILWVFFPPKSDGKSIIKRITNWSGIARKEGLLGLENIAETESDRFARKGLQMLVDGSEPEVIRRVLEVEIDVKEHFEIQAAKVFESMGGYSPTIGIIGAVMGLIHVMENLADPSKLGAGIATAFVSTIYGVGLANLIFLPISNKLKSQVHVRSRINEMMLEGIISIAEGENPRNIETKLQGFLH